MPARSQRPPRLPVLSDRTLNRTLLQRQLLLERGSLPAQELVDRLVGLQAQAPLAPYVALWSRLEGFDAEELSGLMRSRAYVRGHAMRSTIHLLRAEDFLSLRVLSEPAVVRNLTQNAVYGPLADTDRAALAADLRAVLANGPLPRRQLQDRLSGAWGTALAASASSAAAILTACVQATPRGLWRHSGPVMWATAEQWLGVAPPEHPPSPASFLKRYLAAFGPASAADMRTWSGWTGLRELVEVLRPQLRTFRDERGGELYDLPDAPICAPDAPAAVRFLPEYDNVYFSFARRERINPHRYAVPLAPGNGAVMGTFLVDGIYAGTWRRSLAGDASSILTVSPYASLSASDAEALEREGVMLLAFLAPATTADVRIVRPPEA